jgi:hypothetical protein
VANAMTHNLITVYQLAYSTLTEKEFQDRLRPDLETCPWWPFGMDFEIRTSVTTPYFAHFDGASLQAGLPWDILALQGQKQTLFVNAATCFESVLHCWSYGNLLESTPGWQALPKMHNAPIVVLGAGVSGILFAARLKWAGYTNIDILEITDRYAGKTHTVVEHGPYPPGSNEPTVCELGTCYLSPAYADMVNFLCQKGVLAGNQQIDFGDTPSFRGIATTGELPADFNQPVVIDYSDYVVLKAEALLGWPDSELNRIFAKAEIAVALAWYTLIQVEYMGWNPPMPSSQPTGQPTDSLLYKTFAEFLEQTTVPGLDINLLPLLGLLQYGYEVQGYGSVYSIPAFYGLIWFTHADTQAILEDAIGCGTPVVTAWSKGWGDNWTQIVTKLNLNITFLAHTTSIKRPQA